MLLVANIVQDCRSLGKVGSRWGASRHAGNFRDKELGIKLVRSIGGAMSEVTLLEERALYDILPHGSVGKIRPHGSGAPDVTSTSQ